MHEIVILEFYNYCNPRFFIPIKPNVNYYPCNLKYVGVTGVNITTEQNSTLILFKNRTVGQIYDLKMSLDDLQTPDRHCRCGVVTKSTPRISLERFTGAIKPRANQRAVTMTTALRWQGALLLAGRSPPHSATSRRDGLAHAPRTVPPHRIMATCVSVLWSMVGTVLPEHEQYYTYSNS